MRILRSHPHTAASIASLEEHIAPGAAGWIDTDLSASLGTRPDRLWVVDCIHVAAGSVGVRTPGETVDPKYANQHTRVVRASAGHLEFYRDAAADNYYHISGYFT